MYTQCPECQTIYSIDEDALQTSLGIVHCGHCGTRFDALRTLTDTLPADPATALPEQDPADHAPTLTAAVSPAAFEAAARKRPRSHGASGDPADDPTARPLAADPASGPESDATRRPADDWFSDLESEFASTAEATAADDRAFAAAGLDGLLEDATDDLSLNAAAASPTAVTDVTPSTAPEPHAAVAATLSAVPIDAAAPAVAGTSADRLAATADAGNLAANDAAHPGGGSADETAIKAEAVQAIGAPVGSDSALADGSAAGAAAPAPVYVRPRNHRVSARTLAWWAGCGVLALVLAAQLVFAERAALYQNPATRSWIATACGVLPCRLPLLREPGRLEMLSRDVRPDPARAGALTITATLRNDAPVRQAWPVVVVELTDLESRVVAMRRFRPLEYLPDAARRAAGIAPHATVAVAFVVADPGKRAVAFQFRFE